MQNSKNNKELPSVKTKNRTGYKVNAIYQQLALLSDIETAESEEKNGQLSTHSEVKKRAANWLKG